MEMDSATKVQSLNKAVCISRRANTVWKGMNSTILILVMDK